MKRKHADRRESTHIIKKRFASNYMTRKEFTGYVTLLNIDQVTKPLWKQCGEQNVCFVDNGYTWLQHFPVGERFTLTTMFNQRQQIVEHYIDIVKTHGVDEQGVPWYDDLYLDIAVLPTGEFEVLDVEELEIALQQGLVTREDYQLANQELERLTWLLRQQQLDLLGLCEKHRQEMAAMV